MLKRIKKHLKKQAQKTPARAKAGYERAGRIAHSAASPLLRIYLRSKHVRVRALIVNEDKEVLLVRTWFGSQKWSLPGGGIQRVETPAEATTREVFEETGIRIGVDDLHELGTFANPDKGKHYTVACFKLEVPKREPYLAKRHRLEMLEAEWFPLNSLPKERSGVVDIALSLDK